MHKMTDYLSHLVNRSLHPETTLQPRPVSRFEQTPAPIAPLGVSILAPTGEETPAESAPALSPLPPQRREKFSEPYASSPLTPPRPRPLPDDHSAQPFRGRLDIPSHEERFLQTHTIQERVVERAVIPSPVKTEVPPTVPIQKILPPAHEQPHTIPTRSLPTPKENVTPSTVSPKPASPSPSFMTPAIRPALPPMPARPTQTKSPEPAPTINVTIGRVEVRAAPAVSPPPRAPKAPNVMTLDEYLHRRKNGGGT